MKPWAEQLHVFQVLCHFTLLVDLDNELKVSKILVRGYRSVLSLLNLAINVGLEHDMISDRQSQSNILGRQSKSESPSIMGDIVNSSKSKLLEILGIEN